MDNRECFEITEEEEELLETIENSFECIDYEVEEITVFKQTRKEA